MPNPDDEQTTATPPGPDTAASGEASTSASTSSNPSAPEADYSPDGLDPASGSLVDSPSEAPGTPDVIELDAKAEADEPVEANQLAGTVEPGAAGEVDQPDMLHAAEPESQDDGGVSASLDGEIQAASKPEDLGPGDDDNEVVDTESDQVDSPDEEPEPRWEVHGRPGDDEPSYDWPIPPGVRQRQKPLAWIDWRFSLLFPIAVLGAILTLLWSLLSSPHTIEFRVLDAGTGEAIAGAHLIVGNDVYEAGEDGVVVIDRPESPTMVDVTADGYVGVQGELDDSIGSTQDVELRSRELAVGDPAPRQVAVIPGMAT